MGKTHYLNRSDLLNANLNISRLALFFVAGVLPVSSVALHSLGWISIRSMIIPNIIMVSICCYHLFNNDELKRLIARGWLAGIVAVLMYDISRIPFIYMGWEDFIPGLGGWITGSDENFTVGYLWRYLGNGAGLGLGFAALSHFF
ncbi:MAG: hypothetical protein JKY54_14600, partial [Flavobacteriales bacterium]|nr:hypothetical protein [Flavobacteriales bacterium]